MTVKRILCAGRLRRIPAQFSWVDPLLVFDGYLARLDPLAAALYLLLVTVADAQGLSYWGDARVTQLLRTTRVRLSGSRQQLIEASLLAYEPPLYQVLALQKLPPQASAPSPSTAPAIPEPASSTPIASAVDREQALRRLAQLRAQLTAPR